MEVARPKKKTKAKKKTRKVTEEKASERGLEQDTRDTIETNESADTHRVLPPSSLSSPPDLPILPVIDIFDDSTPAVQEPAVQEPIIQEPAVQEPIIQEPAVQEPIIQEPVAATTNDDDLIQFDIVPTQTQQNPEKSSEEHFEDAVDVLPDPNQLTDDSTNETATDGVRVDNAPLLVDLTSEAPPTTTSAVLNNERATTVENESIIEANTGIHVDTEVHVHVQNVNTTAVEEVLEEPAILAAPSEETVLPTAPPTLMYPTLDSLIAASSVTESVLIPYSEEDLSLLYPNPQLGANPEFIDNFIKESQQDSHPLYELLKQYLKARLSSKAAEGKLQNLKKDYSKNNDMIWTITDKRISSNGKCADGKSISHSHSHKFAQLDADAVFRTEDNLKSIKTALQEEYTMLSYSAQLAYIHVEFYIHQLINSMPELADMPQTAPITGYIPRVPPGSMDEYTYELRSCISVLFIFERRPSRDQQFTSSCRNWLNTLIAALLRVASLPDHQFVLNHILRCPPGVGQWAIGYIQPLSPLQYKGVVRQNSNNHDRNGVSMEWKLSSQDYTWDGPIIDHWITMLSTLFQPIIGREEFLSFFSSPRPATGGGGGDGLDRQESQPWTFVEEDEGQDSSASNELHHLMLNESDYISILDQFPITDVFKYLLNAREGHYTISHISSYQMLQFISFCTCLIRLFGRIFTILRHSSYKEFIKQVGRTIRQIVQYVADHWSSYKALKLSAGDTMSCMPSGEDPVIRYSLERLQIEFDQFVLRATQWILTAHKLGAWQFMADMPYGSISGLTLWKILWTLYHYQVASHRDTASDGRERRGSVLMDRTDLDLIPENVPDIIQSIRGSLCHVQFVDILMKTFTSEVIFLLTTFVNMARSRDGEKEEEKEFINFVAQEIFQLTQVEEYARDAYSRSGHTLLDSVARVHPFIMTVLLEETRKHVDEAGENCILLFKELPLHLWLPSVHDIKLVREWLVSGTLTSPQHLIAKVIISGLNWGLKEQEPPCSTSLVLPPSIHRDVSLSIIDLWYHQFTDDSTSPGANPNKTLYSSTINRISKSIRSLLSNNLSDLLSWMWDVTLMLKLHPSQINQSSSAPPTEGGGAKSPAVYKQPVGMASEGGLLPVDNPAIDGFDLLRECSRHDGLIAYYVRINISSIGTDSHQFLKDGLPMLTKMVEQGYYLPVLKILGHVTGLMFENRKMFIEEQDFISLILSVVNADTNDASMKEKLTWTIPSPHIVRRFSAMITSQVHCINTSQSELIFIFWIDVLFSIPSWLRQPNVLYVLNNLCIVSTVRDNLKKILIEKLLELYKFLKPFQPNKRLLSSVTSSVLSMVGQEGGPPSLFNTIDSSEYPWLSYYSLLAEEQFEEQEGVWISLLKLLKKDQKISIDNALKKTLSDLGHTGSSFNVNHLCIYRWADLCSSMDTSFILYPLVWQRYFTLYLQRPIFTASMPERGSLGLRFFSTNRTQGIRRNMRKALTKSFRSLQEELKSIKKENNEEKGKIFLLELLPKLISYYQMLQMWLEEPRLHEETLSLPSLPIQYEPERLSKLFKTQQSDWVEFLRLWEIEDIIKVMLDEWKQVQLYQKALSCRTESHEQSPDTAAARIEKRLRYQSTPVSPPPFVSPPAPFSLLPTAVLLSKTDLLSAVVKDITFIAQQGRTYCERYNSMVALDSEYMSGIPDLYSNQPRQFHVSIPCHRNTACTGPATIVFRFNELTPHAHWEQRVPQNRQEHKELLSALSCPVSFDLCKAVARTEHVVGELSKLSESNDTEALSNGVSLFYEVLKFITSETKQYPPTCQFLSSCIQILGQEFIHRDPSQTATILQLLLAQRSLGDILAPLFDPNLCPPDFISMYVSVRDVAIKEGPTIAFSTLTKFNIPKWLSDYSPSLSDSSQLLKYIFQGISYCGRDPDDDLLILSEGYLSHFSKLLEYQFPLLYNEALHLIIDGTDTGGISPRCWEELSKVTTPTLSTEYDSCRLGLQLLQESLQHLSNFYTQKRFYTKETIYELVSSDYVSSILQFIVMLCTSLINKLLTSIEVENNTIQGALNEAWRTIIDVFRAWILPLINGENNEVTFPCKLERIVTLGESFSLFVQLVSLLQSKFANSESGSPLHLLWFFYCNELSLPATPLHILECYHTHLTSLPWEQYAPDLSAMDLMIKLKINKEVSQMCFVFLGGIFPSFNWKEIARQYSSDLSLSVHFHITFLQLLIMLAAEPNIMNNKDSHVPQLISDAKSFDFHYIDLKTYQDILEWQKNNCTPSSILQTGSSLSLALRLLKAAGSFPLNSTSKPLALHKDGWDKRFSYMRMLVEIISTSSQHKETHSSSYSDIVSFMIHTLIDTVVFEPESLSTVNPVILLQEMINMFNTCHPSDQFVSNLISHVTDCLDQLPNASRLHLPTITAASRTIVSIPLMVKLVEIVITVYFKHYPPAKETTLQLPARMDGYGWAHLSSSLSIPETAANEFYSVCVQQFACYCLNTRLMTQLPRCSSLEEELEILTKVVQSCSSLKPKPNEEHKMFVIWEKILNLSLRQITFGGNINTAINQFTSLANTLQRFGEDKATEGLLGAIGLGKKSIYSLEFRLISRVLATFIHTQLPLDTSQSVHPRLAPGAPGHIKDPNRHVAGFTPVAMATKQADQASASLESLLSNKAYLHLRDYISYSLDMINDLQCNLMNIQQLFVYLVINLYSSERSLDSLRVAQT